MTNGQIIAMGVGALAFMAVGLIAAMPQCSNLVFILRLVIIVALFSGIAALHSAMAETHKASPSSNDKFEMYAAYYGGLLAVGLFVFALGIPEWWPPSSSCVVA